MIKRFCIIIPTYNERENISLLVSQIREHLAEALIYFIDDSSPDGTGEEIERLQTNDNNILLLSRPSKQGLASAYQAGMANVIENNLAEYIITMDADHSHDPKQLPRLISAVGDNDLVIGSRYVTGGGVSNWSAWRQALSRGANNYAKVLSGLTVTDLTSGFVLYKTEFLKNHTRSINADGYAYQIQMKQELINSGAKWTEVPIDFHERREGQSKLSFNIVWEGIWQTFWRFLVRTWRSPENKIAAGLFLLAVIFYGFTAPRTIFFGDNPEFITAAKVLGVPHPPGFPLYVLLTHLFSLIPFGSLAWRVNFFSGVCAAAVLVLFFKLLLKLLPKQKLSLAIALFTTVLLSVSSMYWYQAIVGKTYALNALFVFILIHLIIRYWEAPRTTYFYWASFIFGLGIANHTLLVLFAPLFILMLVRKPHLRINNIIIGLGLFLVGLSVYLLLPLRSLMHPLYDSGNTGASWHNFYAHIMRKSYEDLGVHMLWSDRIRYFGEFFLEVFNQFKYFIVLGVLGIVLTLRKSPYKVLFLLSIIVLNVVGVIALRTAAYNLENSEYYKTYYLPAYIVFTLFIGLGISTVLVYLQRRHKFLPYIAITALAVYGLVTVQWQMVNFRNFTFLEDYSIQMIQTLPDNAIVLFDVEGPATDSILFSLLYQQKVLGARPDITIVGYPGVFPQIDNDQVYAVYKSQNFIDHKNLLITYAEQHYAGRPLFATFISGKSGAKVTSNGLLYEIKPEGDTTALPATEVVISPKDLGIMQSDLFGKDVLTQYYYTQAMALYQKGETLSGQQKLQQALLEDITVPSDNYQSFTQWRGQFQK